MGKGLTAVRSLQRKHMLDSRVREHVQTSLQGIAKKARQDGKYRFRDVYRLINEEMLLVAWNEINKNAICEQDFLPCSFGYRRKLGPLDAVKDITDTLFWGKYTYIVEADIKGFYDNIDHDWMIRILEPAMSRFTQAIR